MQPILKKASTCSLYKELSTGEEKDYRVEGGYQQMVSYLENQCRQKGVHFYLGEEVKEIKWSKFFVEAVTTAQTIKGKKILITVSVGVLQSEAIRFSPALPEKMAAAKNLGYGPVAKVILCFTDAFWKDKALTRNKDISKFSFLFSDEALPTWWTHYPQDSTQLTGWLAGPSAIETKDFSVEEITQRAILSLAKIFDVDAAFLQQKLVTSHWYNWIADPHYCGAYSYEVVNGEQWMKIISEPVDHTVYFAGEGLYHGNEIGTVEAALTSGRNIAHQLVAHFSS